MIITVLLSLAALTFAFLAIYFLLRNIEGKKLLHDTQQQLDEVANQEKGKLISVISSLADGVIVLDSAHKPWIINDSARKFLNITKETPTFEDINQQFAKDVNLREKIDEVMKFNRTATLNEVSINYKIFQIFITPIGLQKIIGASVLLQDITAEKSIEKMKEEFSHIIVHELRAPVVAIKDSAILMAGGNLSADEQKNMLNLIHEQSQKLLTQISTILDAAKVQDGKLTLNKTPGDLGIVLQKVLSLFLPEAKNKKITLVAEIGNNLPIFSFDNNKITEALNNVLSNSLKYTNENGIIKITVDTDDIYERTKTEGNIVVTISDNGIGIPEEKQQMLFTKFSQFNDNAKKEAQKLSSGLGLYITKGIIEAHNGTISIQSAVGKGTTTTFKLPINNKNEPKPEDFPVSHLPN